MSGKCADVRKLSRPTRQAFISEGKGYIRFTCPYQRMDKKRCGTFRIRRLFRGSSSFHKELRYTVRIYDCTRASFRDLLSYVCTRICASHRIYLLHMTRELNTVKMTKGKRLRTLINGIPSDNFFHRKK